MRGNIICASVSPRLQLRRVHLVVEDRHAAEPPARGRRRRARGLHALAVAALTESSVPAAAQPAAEALMGRVARALHDRRRGGLA
jgi:hypothetical protein